MKKYRKLPIEIEAAKWDGARLNGEHPWHFLGMKNWYRGSPSDNLVIETLEGKLIAKPGDWIIKGIKGEFYPIKENIFLESYEEVEEMTGYKRSEETAIAIEEMKQKEKEKNYANAFRSSVNQKQKDSLDAVYLVQDEVFDKVLAIVGGLKGAEGLDMRFYAIWATHMEEGFMALRKSISQPHGRLRADGRPA